MLMDYVRSLTMFTFFNLSHPCFRKHDTEFLTDSCAVKKRLINAGKVRLAVFI